MATATATSNVYRWLRVAGVVALLGALLFSFTFVSRLTLRDTPPVEAIAFERTILEPGRIELHLRNDGRDEVRIAQVLINDAYWTFEIEDAVLGRLESTVLTAEYPWDDGNPLAITLITSTGVTIPHAIEAASATPETDARTIWTYAALGIYIGLIPVLIGLFAFPFLKRLPARWLGFFLALTIGLLAFLLVDSFVEGSELAAAAPGALDGRALFAIGAVLVVLVLTWFEGWQQRRSAGSEKDPLRLSYLIATGIGLHNLGEGLAVGAALAAGEVGLGAGLIVGFALHNTTEGLAIVSPLGPMKKRPSLLHFMGLGAVAGLPTVLGAWAGGFAFSAAWGALAFGVAFGAIVQVIWAISRSMKGEASLSRGLPAVGFAVGLIVMYTTGLIV